MRRALILLCGLALLLTGVGVARAMPSTWSDPSTVGPRGDWAPNLSIAASADGQVALIVWWARTGSSYALHVSRSTDAGSTWSDATLDTATGSFSQPQVELSADGQRAIILTERVDSGYSLLRSFMSGTGGASWSASTDISIPAVGVDQMNPQLTLSADGNRVGAFWTRYGAGSIVVAEFAGSSDGGVTWSAPIRLNATFASNSASAPSLAASRDGRVLVAGWAEFGGDEPAFTARSTDFGATWGPYTQVTGPSLNISSTRMTASSTGQVMATLVDAYSYPRSSQQLSYAVSDDTGATWDDSGLLAPAGGSSPQLLMDDSGSGIAAVWAGFANSTYTVWTRTSGDRGATWDDSLAITTSPQNLSGVSAAMSADGTQLIVVWTRGNATIEVSTSTDRGASWSSPVVLSGSAVASRVVLNPDASAALVGWSDSAGVIQAVSAPPPPLPVPPAPVAPADPPRDVSATPMDGGALVSWNAPSSSGSFPVSHYLAISTPGAHTCLVAMPALTCEVSRLTNGTAYTFTVKALTGAGWSGSSDASNVVVPRPSAEPPIVIMGSRDGRRIEVTGTTTGFGMGAILNPWVRLAGQSAYAQGSAQVLVSVDGTFSWGRATGKKASVYMQTPDGAVRSNTVAIR